jgi:hypothetical protein
VQDAALAKELLARVRADQDARAAMSRASGPDGVCRDLDINQRIAAIDRSNTEWMRPVLASGWPGRSRVGEAGAHAAWLLCQHADQDPDLQRSALALLEEAFARGDAPGRHVAYLTDRVFVAEDRPQRYGTQFHPREGKLEPRPIQDPETLDERRAAMDLEPFADYARWFLEGFPTPPPAAP